MCSWFLELLNGTSIRRKIQTATIWERVKKLLNSRRNLLPTTIIWIPIGRKRKISWTWQQCHQLKSQSIIIDFTFILLKIYTIFQSHLIHSHRSKLPQFKQYTSVYSCALKAPKNTSTFPSLSPFSITQSSSSFSFLKIFPSTGSKKRIGIQFFFCSMKILAWKGSTPSRLSLMSWFFLPMVISCLF